jgi:hypothetical protein
MTKTPSGIEVIQGRSLAGGGDSAPKPSSSENRVFSTREISFAREWRNSEGFSAHPKNLYEFDIRIVAECP